MQEDKEHINPSQFDPPKGYFEDFGIRLQEQIALEEVLGGKLTSGFVVPEGYFDTLSRKLSSIPEKSRPETKVIALTSRKWLWTSISAVAAVLLFFILILNTEDTTGFDSLDLATIEDYMSYDDTSYSAYELGDLLTEEALETLNTGSNIDDELLMDYLENDIDTYDLLIE